MDVGGRQRREQAAEGWGEEINSGAAIPLILSFGSCSMHCSRPPAPGAVYLPIHGVVPPASMQSSPGGRRDASFCLPKK